jgi:hypothetical protein
MDSTRYKRSRDEANQVQAQGGLDHRLRSTGRLAYRTSVARARGKRFDLSHETRDLQGHTHSQVATGGRCALSGRAFPALAPLPRDILFPRFKLGKRKAAG